MTKLDSLFDISAPDCENRIKADRLRTEQAVKEDIMFLHDQQGSRKMVVGKRDANFDKSVGDKEFRNSRIKRMSNKSDKKNMVELNNNESDDKGEEVSSDDNSDEDLLLKIGKRNLRWLLLLFPEKDLQRRQLLLPKGIR